MNFGIGYFAFIVRVDAMSIAEKRLGGEIIGTGIDNQSGGVPHDKPGVDRPGRLRRQARKRVTILINFQFGTVFLKPASRKTCT